MSSFRVFGLVVCVSLGLSLTACKKDEGGGSGGGGAAAGGGAAKTKDLDLIPVDSEVVLGINIAQAQSSALFKQLVLPRITGDAQVQASIEKFKAKCNMDPMTAMTSMTIGMRNTSSPSPEAVMVIHGLDKAKTLDCIDKMKDELAQQKMEITRDGDVLLVKSGNADQPGAFKFINDKTAVATFGPKGTKAGVEEIAQGKSALGSSKEFVDMFGRVKTGDTLWFLVNGSIESLASQLKQVNVSAKAIYGSVNVTDGLALDARMRLESEDSAKKFAELMKTQVAAASGMVDKVDVGSEGPDVKVFVSLSQEKLKGLMGMFGGMLGGMMGQ